MKISTKRRLLALLLAVGMILTLSPVPQAAENGGETNDPPASDSENPGGDENPPADNPGEVQEIKLGGDPALDTSNNTLILEPNTSENQGARIEVTLDPKNNFTDALHVVWTPKNSAIVGVDEQENGHTGNLFGKSPGEETVTVTAGSKSVDIAVTVRGLKLSDELAKGLQIQENQSVTIEPGKDFFFYPAGELDNATLRAEVVNNKTSVNPLVQPDKSILVDAIREDNATVRIIASVAGRNYEAEFPVTITSNESVIEWTEPVSPSKPLKFSDLESRIGSECQKMTGAALASIVDLSVSTSQGIIYLGYKSPEDMGAGAGSSITYYASAAARGPYIKDLTFVPSPSYGGEKATITFTGQAAASGGKPARTFRCRVEVTLSDTHTEVTLTTRADVPLKLKAEDFARACQAQTGGSLSYVIFTLPSAAQGVLYRDYKSALDYGARVAASEQYDRKGLNDITFVPTQGFVGKVTISYAGYSTTGSKYSGELVINVTRPLDASIQYQDYGTGSITFRGSDFDAYSESMTGSRMGAVSFTPPPASQGVLYRSGSTASWNAVASGDTFSLTALNYVTFTAAEGFDGVVRIPFSGTSWNGTPFSGTAELHIQGAAAQNGDITYACQPGQSVKLQVSDFNSLCQSVTGQRLYYVSFQSLPDYTQGSLFYNRTSSGAIGTRVTTASKYFHSAAPYLNNVSFWAAQGFRSVEIPFTIASVSGETFTGLLTISSGEGAGSGRAASVTYSTSGQQPVTFSGPDFDAVCRQATNSALNYLRLSLPSSGQGILYYDYRANSTPQAFNPATNLYLNGDTSISKVTFVPASGAYGVVYLPFTATAINGSTFQGTVEISIRSGAAMGSIVHYSTGGAPVRFQSSDLAAASGSGQPASIRLTGLPNASQGRVYYQYTSPTKYSWMGNTTTTYSVTGDPSVSNLTFIPKAGYQGVVTIPYTATGYDGTAAAGTIEITVTLSGVSENFDDMAGYSAQTVGAVDYLSSQGVVNGVAYRQYSPGAAIRRGDFCLMLSRAFQFNVGGTGRGFSDVPEDSYYAQAIQQMYALGVVNGVGGGRFQPTANISRQDAALMVRRALEKAALTLPEGSNEAALANYKDRDQVAEYARDALGSLVRAGLFPASQDSLRPREAITRADMALLLHRAMTNFA